MYSELCRAWVVSLTPTKQEKISLTRTKQEKISLTRTRAILLKTNKPYKLIFRLIIIVKLL